MGTETIEERVVPPGNDAYLEQTWDLKQRIQNVDGVLKQGRAYFDREYRGETVYLLLVDDGREVVAFAVIHADGYLSLLGVAPGERRQGLGSQLIETLLEDYSTVTCHTRATNRQAIEFYDHVGFTVEERIDGYYRDGTDALYLRHEHPLTD